MSAKHPPDETLVRFMAGDLPEEEALHVLRHLATRCPQCQAAAAPLWFLEQAGEEGEPAAVQLTALPAIRPLHAPHVAQASGVAPVAPQPAMLEARSAERPDTPLVPSASRTPMTSLKPPTLLAPRIAPPAADEPMERPTEGAEVDFAEYDAALERVLDRIAASEATMQAERAQGHELFEELMRHLPAHQQLLVGNSARFRNRVLCDLLINESHEAGFQEPPRAIGLARLAVEVAGHLGVEACGGAELWNGLRARAWAQLGNALRINCDHAAAERAFEVAESFCSDIEGVGLLDRARVLDLEASLRRAQLRLTEAGALLDRVIAIYKKLGQTQLLGRALNQRATVCFETGESEAQIALLSRALELLNAEEDPRVFLAARHNLILALHCCGRAREAFALLFHTRPLYLKTGDRMSLLRLRWLEGRVALGLERLDQAEAAFREVRDAMRQLGQEYDVAQASVDLATVLCAQGRTAELRDLAGELLVTLESRDIHREAAAALACFCTSAARELAGIELLRLTRDISGFLQRARSNPALRFAPSG